MCRAIARVSRCLPSDSPTLGEPSGCDEGSIESDSCMYGMKLPCRTISSLGSFAARHRSEYDRRHPRFEGFAERKGSQFLRRSSA